MSMKKKTKKIIRRRNFPPFPTLSGTLKLTTAILQNHLVLFADIVAQ
jgi:hypothetical protein